MHNPYIIYVLVNRLASQHAREPPALTFINFAPFVSVVLCVKSDLSDPETRGQKIKRRTPTTPTHTTYADDTIDRCCTVIDALCLTHSLKHLCSSLQSYL